MPKTASIDPPKPEQIKPDLTQEHGDNGPSNDDILFFRGQFITHKEKIKEAQALNKKMRQAAKNRGIDVMELDWLIKVADQEDDTELERLRTRKKYAQAAGLPLGWQMDLFDSPAGNARAAEALEAKAYRTGYERGVAGLFPDEQAYPPALPEGQEHMRGWNEGQKVNADKLLKLNEEIEAERAAKEAKKQAKADDAGEDTRH